MQSVVSCLGIDYQLILIRTMRTFPVKHQPHRMKWILVPSGLLVLMAVIWTFRNVQHPANSGIDFVQFHVTAQHVVRGGDPRIYAPQVRTSILNSAWDEARFDEQNSRRLRALEFRRERSWETYSSPFLYTMFIPYSAAATYETAIQAFWLLSIGSTIVGCVMFSRDLNMPVPGMAFAAAFLVLFDPLQMDLNVANVAQLQLGMLGILVWILGRPLVVQNDLPGSHRKTDNVLIRRDLIAAFWFALCLAFKPGILWCGIMLLVSRAVTLVQSPAGEQRAMTVSRAIAAVGGAAMGTVVAVAVSSIWFPLDSWTEWIQAVRSMPDDIVHTGHGNYSPTWALQHRFGVSPWLMRMSGPLLATVVTGAVVGGTAGRFKGSNHAFWIALGCQIQLLTSHLVWYHYCVLAIPAILVALRTAITAESIALKILLSTILLWCVLLLGVQPFDNWILSSHEEQMLRCLLGNGGLLFLTVWGFRRTVLKGERGM